MVQTRNLGKCPGREKPACTITFVRQKPYFVLYISMLIVLLGETMQKICHLGA